MKHPVSQELFQYWDTLRGIRTAPERSDLDPSAIRSILADTFVLEVANRPGSTRRRFSIRLSGTRFNALFLDELKGRSILSLWRLDQRCTMEDLLDGVIDDQVVTVAGVQGAPAEMAKLDLELLLLPLYHHGQTNTRLLGSLAPVRVPSWLGLKSVTDLSLTSMRSVAGPSLPRMRLGSAVLGGAAKPAVRHGRFMVHEGGR